jgi:hypothetical protein
VLERHIARHAPEVSAREEEDTMIQVKKGSAPEVLTTSGKSFQDEAVNYAKSNDCDTKFKSAFEKHASYDSGLFAGYASQLFSDYSYYSDPTVKRQLIVDHYGKCAFCESFIMDTDVGDVEHYRPKAEVSVKNHNYESGETLERGHTGYFWLSQTWENLYLSCKQCNQTYKGNLFDVIPDLAGGGSAGEPRLRHDAAQDLELPLLLCPGDPKPDPRALIRFNPATAEAVAQDDGSSYRLNLVRAGRTIEIAGLNRPRLIEARAEHLLRLRGHFVLAATQGGVQPDNQKDPNILEFEFARDCAGSDAVAALQRAVQPFAEFSALAQDAIAAWNKELVLKLIQIQVSHKSQNTVFVNTNMNLRMTDQITLAERLRKANEKATAAEAEPDTKDIDRQYNEALARYRDLVQTNREEIPKAVAARAAADKIYALIREKQERDEGPLFESIENIARAPRSLDDETRAFEAMVKDAQKTEVPFDAVYSPLSELHEEVASINFSYEQRGVKEGKRFKRSKKLETCISNLLGYLSGDEKMSEQVEMQLRKKSTGWPPRITGI